MKGILLPETFKMSLSIKLVFAYSKNKKNITVKTSTLFTLLGSWNIIIISQRCWPETVRCIIINRDIDKKPFGNPRGKKYQAKKIIGKQHGYAKEVDLNCLKHNK